MFPNRSRWPLVLAAALAVASSGCGGRYLSATPNLLQRPGSAAYFAACPPPCRGPNIEVLYATDRSVERGAHGEVYGHGRAKRLVFGAATVAIDPAPAWPQLVADSTTAERRRSYALKPTLCRELGAFDPQWSKLEPDATGLRLCAAAVEDLRDQRAHLHALLRERLARTDSKDVFVFVHGFNNTFDDAVARAAEVWHFLGRVGVPVVYTWPAGYGGLRGYAYDRESGEFTVFHLKNFLSALASCPEVERLHIIAHSRGTDVAISALRELNIACRARGESTRQVLKLENLVLAAPDLDEDVFLQRFIAEDLLRAVGRTTIYASRRDKAIELADVVFASRRRLGQLGPRDISPQARQVLARLPSLQFIECRVSHFSTSHDYVFAHPAALSDLILVLRDRRPPGAENGRPLLQPVEGIWELRNDYLLPRAGTLEEGAWQPSRFRGATN